VEIQNRHHWLDANVDTFERVMAPLGDQMGAIPGIARVVNTGTMAFTLSFLANHVLGQYDPLLLADGDEHALYFVRPNILRVAEALDVEYDRFRRWIAFHEVTHAAEFGAAPWLSTHLETAMEEAISNLTSGTIDRESLGQLDTTMTAVEGYAELVMDRAFDEEYADLRQKVEQRRKGRNPVEKLVRRLLGLSVKRRQYERGKEFFEAVVDLEGMDVAALAWESPDALPTDAELDDPGAWIRRVA
jgi:uncharacterized protein (DUF2342 family)